MQMEEHLVRNSAPVKGITNEAEQPESYVEEEAVQQSQDTAHEDTHEQQSNAQTEEANIDIHTSIGMQYYAALGAPQEHHMSKEGAAHSLPKGLTFSGPPYVPKAKPYHRNDFSHSKTKLLKIAHDNQKLVQRLTSISHQEPSWAKDLTSTAPCNVASSAVNRRKAASTIAQENHALYQRLVGIKPSKDISKETLEAQHRRNEAYRINCATFKAGEATGQTA